MPPHVLVIGGTGFIGGHCVEAFLKSGFDVTVLHRGKTANMFGDRVRSIQVNCSDKKAFVTCLQSLVGQEWALVADFIAFEPKHVRYVLKGLSKGKVGLYIMISSDSVYQVCSLPSGVWTTGIKEESDSLLNLPKKQLKRLDDYGYDKLRCERVLRRYTQEFGIESFPWVAFRLPDVIGERL